jgi:tellurite resistance protein
MKLNRHNYEEYFILYADNELCSDERRMVEEFVSLNPDLKDELDGFCSTVLLPDTSVQFRDKQELFRYDDVLIAYIDNELPADEKAGLEKLVSSVPSLQKELELYRKTKLQPEEIVFENKSVLYRHEERKIAGMAWIRWAAAAVILLAVSITTIIFINNKPNAPGTAGLTPENNQPVTSETPGSEVASNIDQKQGNPAATNDNKTSGKNGGVKQSVATGDKQKSKTPGNPNHEPILIPEDKKQLIALNTTGTNNLPTPEFIPEIKTTDYKEQMVETQKNVNDSYTAKVDVTNKQPDTYIYAGGPQTVIDEEEGQNKKSRGLFRKLTRVFEKNTGIKATTDDDKLHIAAFTVKLK